MQAVILAAGRGTRLHPITANRSKAMCPVAGKPMVARVMDTLLANGVREFVLVVSPKDAEIREYFASPSQSGVRFHFVTQDQPLGMGHALQQAAPFIRDDFILSACDSLVRERSIHHLLQTWVGDPPPNGVLALLRAAPADLPRMGVVALTGERVTQIVEKPAPGAAPSNIGSLPLYVFTPRLLDYVAALRPSPRGELELQDAIQALIVREGDVFGLLLPERFDLTTPADLLGLNLRFLAAQNGDRFVAGEVGAGCHFVPPVRVEAGARVGAGCVLGPRVYVEAGAVIGGGARLEDCVVLREARVAGGATVKNRVLW